MVAEPESNPGLVRDCETLMGLRDSLAGRSIAELESKHPHRILVRSRGGRLVAPCDGSSLREIDPEPR